ncbi:MAG: hypothetical protein JNM63_05730, partial [Spirochaetia bacterium]|nr:hypothetical protein [Spirochaetia bacterium]
MSPRFFETETQSGTFRVTPLTPHLFRIQVNAEGRFRDGALLRYGILKNDWPEVKASE